MTVKPKVDIVRHVPLKDISKRIREAKIEVKKLEKLMFIEACYLGLSMKEAIEVAGTSHASGYRWLKRWNEEGLQSLEPRKSPGRPSFLSDDDKAKLKAIMLETDYLTTERLHEMIFTLFKIDYTYKQVRIIAHQLGFEYKKPYPNYDKTPIDAELQLKKTPKDYH